MGTGAIISIVFHAAVVGVALWLSLAPAAEKAKDTVVTFFAAPPPPPPPPPPGGGSKPKQHIEKKKVQIKKPDQIIQPKEIPKEEPPKEDPKPEEPEKEDDGEPGGVEGGVKGGVVGGVVGGVIGGTLGGQLGGQLGSVLAFGEGMTRPELLSGVRDSELRYTREALEARVQGLMIVKCTITADGSLTNCRIIKPLQFMEKTILEALATRKYKPVTYQGKPVTVDYVFNIRLVMPNR